MKTLILYSFNCFLICFFIINFTPLSFGEKTFLALSLSAILFSYLKIRADKRKLREEQAKLSEVSNTVQAN
jgi:hypothetical protein